MHHGYYGDTPGGASRSVAQERLIGELLKFSNPQKPVRILDAGCGIGGSACYLAQEYAAEVLGVTISREQSGIAAQVIEDHGMEERVVVREQDLMSLSAYDGPFDLIWCVECLEHISEKDALLNMFGDLAAPEGDLVLTTWCLENEYERDDVLDKIYRAFRWAPMCTVEELTGMVLNAGFDTVDYRDWTGQVKPYWREIRKSAIKPANVKLLRHFSWSAIRGVQNLKHLERAVNGGMMRYIVLSCKR